MYSSSNFFELLGRADDLVIQVTVESSTGSPSYLKIYYQISNDGAEGTFKDCSTLSSITSPVAGNMDIFYPLGSNPNGAFGRIRVDHSGVAQGTAAIRVIACGRTRGS